MKVKVSQRMHIFMPHTVQMCKYEGILEYSRIFTVRNEVAKVMFLHLSVCPQGGSPSVHAGIPPPPPPPGPDTPRDQTRHLQEQPPQGACTTIPQDQTRHPTVMHSC